MTAEGGTGHLQVAGDVMRLLVDHHGAQLLDALLGQRGGLLQEALVVGHIDVQMGAVRAQTGVQAGGAAGSQVAADVGGAEQQDLGLEGFYHIHNDLGIAIRGIVLQQGIAADIDLVRTVAAQLLGKAVHIVAQQQAAELRAQLVGQLTALGDQLEGGGHHHALALFTEYPNVLERADISTIKTFSYQISYFSLYLLKNHYIIIIP